MNCKYCGNPVDEGYIFCSNCGGRTQDENIQQTDPNPAMPMTPPVYNYGANPVNEETLKKKKKQTKIIVTVVISVFVLFMILGGVGGYFLSRYILDNMNKPETEYEILAYDYVENYISTGDFTSFENSSAVDFSAIYEEMASFYSEYWEVTEEEYYQWLSDDYYTTITNSDELIKADFDYIFDSFTEIVDEEFGVHTYEIYMSSSEEMSAEDIEYFYEKIDGYLSQLDLSIEDFIDKSLVTEAYSVQIEYYIKGEKTSVEYSDYSFGEIIVINYGGEYKVLYDDYLIDWLYEMMIFEE